MKILFRRHDIDGKKLKLTGKDVRKCKGASRKSC
jgi:hypothetical protein